jgi:hypothetical protein
MKLLLENWRQYLAENDVGEVKSPPTFSPCFGGKEKIFEPLLNQTLEIIEMVINRNVDDWPQTIECMTDEEIEEGEEVGGGHGLYLGDEQTIKINSSMDPFNIYLNFVHESLHHAKPELTGPKFSSQHRHVEINESLMKQVMEHMAAFLNEEEKIKEQIPGDFIKGLEEYE